MNRGGVHLVLVACTAGLCWLVAPGVRALSLDEAAAALGDDCYRTREQAEQVIRAAGLDAYDRVATLARSADPEVAGRARSCLGILLLDIDDTMPAALAAALRVLDRLDAGRRDEAVAGVIALDPPRPLTLLALHARWSGRTSAGPDARHPLLAAIEGALAKVLRDPAACDALARLRPERYPPSTLAVALNLAVKHHPADLAPVLPLHARWLEAHPDLADLLNADGYRLEIARLAGQQPDRLAALRTLLRLGWQLDGAPDRLAALRKELDGYRGIAASLPLDSVEVPAAWFFFDTFGTDQGGAAHLAAYREFRRRRCPEPPSQQLLGQPLEVLLVLEKSGAGAAMEHALKQSVHGGVVLLGEWLHAHPELVREPLPLPPVEPGQPYPYRTVKFFRTFAPYATEEELRQHREIDDACRVLARAPGWAEVARQAREIMAQQAPAAR